ncbi:MAG: hypothetical protein HOV66_29650 [Streptomycetaceae bacterium]|uniref:hypothetical protein n=1 Tax=Streptomycetaceae TaxID=2062 RepID=UPI0017E29EF6|nr:hypothetical protein [Streptomycetaceae bacterium]NUS58988.1 hypothetical protein [Streptomycetaceae bacterium]
MTTPTIEIETGLVDLSSCALGDVMANQDPPFVDALWSLVHDLGQGAASQAAGGGGGVTPCDGDDI